MLALDADTLEHFVIVAATINEVFNVTGNHTRHGRLLLYFLQLKSKQDKVGVHGERLIQLILLAVVFDLRQLCLHAFHHVLEDEAKGKCVYVVVLEIGLLL